MQKVPFSVDARGKLEKLKMHCFINHSGGSVQGKGNFLEHRCKKLDDNLNSTVCVLYKQCTWSLVSCGEGSWCSSGNKRDTRIEISGGMCVWEQLLGMGWRWCPQPGIPPSSQGAALSSARDGAPGALKPQQTQLLLQFPENLTHHSFCHLIEIIMK